MTTNTTIALSPAAPDLLPCPFCGAQLEPFGPNQHNHPAGECWLAHVRLERGEQDRWNRRAQLARQGQGDIYACKGKGGAYELLGVATGAGKAKLVEPLTIYRDTASGALYFRAGDDFAERMERTSAGASPAQASAAQADPFGDRWHSLTCDGTCSPPCEADSAAEQARTAVPVAPVAASPTVPAQPVAAAADAGTRYQMPEGVRNQIETLEWKLRNHERALEMRKQHDRADVWYWQDDGGDNLDTMSMGMVVVIRADQLRGLLAGPASATSTAAQPVAKVGDSSGGAALNSECAYYMAHGRLCPKCGEVHGAEQDDRFINGYFCAVGVALREDGDTTIVRSLFQQGGDPRKADPLDIELFKERGLMQSTTTGATDGAVGGA